MVSAQEIIDLVKDLGSRHGIKTYLSSQLIHNIAYYPLRDIIGFNHMILMDHINRISKEIPSYNWKQRITESFNHELEHRKIYKILGMYFPESIENSILTGVEDYYIDVILSVGIKSARLEILHLLEIRPDTINDLKRRIIEAEIPSIFSIIILFTYNEIEKYLPEHSEFLFQLKDRLDQIRTITDIPLAYKDCKEQLIWRYGKKLRWYMT